MKQIEALGRRLANVMLNQTDAYEQIKDINEALAGMAMAVTGVRADQLADENLEDKPVVRLYWTTLAELTAKVLHSAADQQSYYKELDK